MFVKKEVVSHFAESEGFYYSIMLHLQQSNLQKYWVFSSDFDLISKFLNYFFSYLRSALVSCL
jgi:hypothetical protein